MFIFCIITYQLNHKITKMSSSINLEHNLESLENLPVELQRNFTLMRDLDSRVQELMRNIDKLTADYMSNVKRYTEDKKREMLTNIQRQFDKAKGYSDDKVQLSIQTYELVDKHVRKFDSDLARFGAEIQDKAISAIRNMEENSQKRGCNKIKDKEINKKSASSEEETAPNKTSKKKQLIKGVTKTTSAAPCKTPLINVVTNPKNPTNRVTSVTAEANSTTGAGIAHSTEVFDMPVDPNEPTYCLCNQVSYGEMIGCDNPDCPIEWFHFACVKLTTKPKGKWFCLKSKDQMIKITKMSSALKLENFLDSLENLPVELQRNFTLMRDLDSRVQELMRNIDKLTADYMSNVKRYTEDKKREMLTNIQRQFDKAKGYSDDKVQLSIQTYELVDKHVRKFDSDLACFGAEIQDKAISAIRNMEENSQKRGCKNIKDKEINKKSASSEEETAPNKTSKKKQLIKGVTKTTSAAPCKTPLINVVTNPKNPTNRVTSVTAEANSTTGAGIAHSTEVFDMPVDPNEPTYCLCNQVSYGEMIGCDNPDCPIEWFHFACVKLTTKPKGKWFCLKCTTDRKKK
ncbi:uncharacterized protein LOC113559059 [Rhopalosiphum maidis]|uniref:uncharacterized protein LOC113559059 n=1 Tax=Rhopalosiphum maidis TaxID=43146 RepID=UPI00101C52EE|nr:uncharacterized protein LOC113559059 [Rhopalosiphum maidis]